MIHALQNEGSLSPSIVSSGFSSINTHFLVREVVNSFFEAEEEIREKSNDALREIAKIAMQDPNLLHEWILQDWQYATLAHRTTTIL